jgi:hypothetical protein
MLFFRTLLFFRTVHPLKRAATRARYPDGFSVANASAARGQIWKSADTAAQPSQAAGGSKAARS